MLVKNIGTIVGIDESGRTRVSGKAMGEITMLENAWLLTDGTRIKDYGTMDTLPNEEGQDIKSTTQIVELSSQRVMVKDTDKGRELVRQIEDLKKLLKAYRIGMIKERVN